mmetsp:Transcript_69107/g.202350  ORF Transcript_69107/g.202350 Transcript_69107/m.202350 type:complete len:207 (+) Transcript_69107:102-722(+)
MRFFVDRALSFLLHGFYCKLGLGVCTRLQWAMTLNNYACSSSTSPCAGWTNDPGCHEATQSEDPAEVWQSTSKAAPTSSRTSGATMARCFLENAMRQARRTRVQAALQAKGLPRRLRAAQPRSTARLPERKSPSPPGRLGAPSSVQVSISGRPGAQMRSTAPFWMMAGPPRASQSLGRSAAESPRTFSARRRYSAALGVRTAWRYP